MSHYKQWTRANKRRRRAVQSHLGDVYGDPMPMVLHRRRTSWDAVATIKAAVCAASGFILVCIVIVILFLFAMAYASQVRAHGPAEWIQRGAYKNAAGELCCGERDCFELTDGDVRVTSGGYYIISIKETVPFNEAAPSPDGRYWRCQWGGSRKCFFAPPGQT